MFICSTDVYFTITTVSEEDSDTQEKGSSGGKYELKKRAFDCSKSSLRTVHFSKHVH